MNVHVHIDRLILDGLPVEHNQGGLVRAAVEAELARLLAGGSLSPDLATGGALPAVRVGAIRLGETHGPTALGQQVARAVYGGIGK